MIDYVEIRSASLEPLGLIDTAKSIIWETQYFGAGSFEIYTEATAEAIKILQVGNFVTRLESDGVGIIEAINVTFDAVNGRMITASGRLAKSILDRRLITYVSGNTSAQISISGNVEARARGLVQDNAIACYRDKARTVPYTERDISILQLGALSNLPAVTDLRQVSNENLLTYTDDFLRQYGYGAKLIRVGRKVAYTVYSGVDRSIGNADGNEPVIFSEDFDNLTGSDYIFDENGCKSFALVGGEGEGENRFFVECNANQSGLARREIFIDSSIAREVYEEKFIGDGGASVDGTRVFALPSTATGVRRATIDGKEQEAIFYPAAPSVGFMFIPLEGAKIVVQYYTSATYNETFTGSAPKAVNAFTLTNKAAWIESATVNSISKPYDFDKEARTVTFRDAPADGTKIVIIYSDGVTKYTDTFYGVKQEQGVFKLEYAVTQVIKCLVDGVDTPCEIDTKSKTIAITPAPAKGAKIDVDYIAGNEYFEVEFTGDGVEGEGEGTTTFVLSHHATALRSVKVDGKDAVWTFSASTNTITFGVAPANGAEIIVEYIDDDEYREQLTEAGKQELATLIAAEGFEGSIDLTNSSFEYGVDFDIGDIVTVQDNGINKYINVRVVSVDEVQDDNGYQVNLNFEAV